MRRNCSYGKSRLRSDWEGCSVLFQVLRVIAIPYGNPYKLVLCGVPRVQALQSCAVSRRLWKYALWGGEGGGRRLLVQERGSFTLIFFLCFSIRVRRGGPFFVFFFNVEIGSAVSQMVLLDY